MDTVHECDRQTDRQTDGRTDRITITIRPCRLRRTVKTPQSFHRPRCCGVQTFLLEMHYGGEKFGKEWSDFDPQRKGSYFGCSGLWRKVSSKLNDICDRRRGDRHRAGLNQSAALFQLSSPPLFLIPAHLFPSCSSHFPSLSLPSLSRSGPLTTNLGSGIGSESPRQFLVDQISPSTKLVSPPGPPIYFSFPFPFSRPPLPSLRSRPLKYS